MEKYCEWSDDDAKQMVHNKKAIEAAMFIMFVVYTSAVALSEIKRTAQVRY